jgi:hypothetical protein
MADVKIARVVDFPTGSRRVMRSGRVEIGVFNVNGQYYALPNVCAHQFEPLCKGLVTGTFIDGTGTPGRKQDSLAASPSTYRSVCSCFPGPEETMDSCGSCVTEPPLHNTGSTWRPRQKYSGKARYPGTVELPGLQPHRASWQAEIGANFTKSCISQFSKRLSGCW